MSSAVQQSVVVSILRWHAWEGTTNELPELKSVDPLLRRRLSPQGRAALAVAEVCAQGVGPLRVVYASQHGELARTLGLMESLRPEDPDGPSPTSFALSVLNSTPGIYSIARKDTSPVVAVSAGPESAWCGLLEAGITACEELCPVLLIAADAPVPALFRHGEPDSAPIRALAVLIGSGGESYELSFGEGPSTNGSALTALAAALASGGGWGGGGRTWRLTKHA
jgi:hypothetical protein